jgi:hypothetical protein
MKHFLGTIGIMLAMASGTPSALAQSAPFITVSVVGTENSISCRIRARSKYLELGARDVSRAESNSQWGTVGSMQALVWCRDTQAIIVVGGPDNGSVVELRDEIKKAF